MRCSYLFVPLTPDSGTVGHTEECNRTMMIVLKLKKIVELKMVRQPGEIKAENIEVGMKFY